MTDPIKPTKRDAKQDSPAVGVSSIGPAGVPSIGLAGVPSIGIEEEYQLVDPATGCLVPSCKKVMKRIRRGHKPVESEIVHELHLNQIEMASPVCQTLQDARRHLMQTRSVIGKAAIKSGSALVSAASNPMPLPTDDDVTNKKRYRKMTQRYQQIARDLYIFGCHVHVSMPDRDLGVAVINRCRIWLPLLQSLTGNSPYWDGGDTGYDSFRREMWMQWPMAGPPPALASAEQYDQCVSELVAATAIADATNVYWDIRLPDKVPTIEFRAADAMTNLNHTVAYAGLIRGMVMAAIDDQQSGHPLPRCNDHVLRYAIWFAARYGMSKSSIDVVAGKKVLLANQIDALLDWIGPSLKRCGGDDHDRVTAFVRHAQKHGNGATAQRIASGHRPVDDYDQPSTAQFRSVVEWAVKQSAVDCDFTPAPTAK